MTAVPGLIGRKLGQTTLLLEDGRAVPVTVIEAGPCVVVQKKTRGGEGYEALQIGFGEQRESRVKRPQAGHFKKAGTAPRRILREVRVEDGGAFEVGQILTVAAYEGVSRVDVTGVTKGKGFQGVVKRHGFGGGAASHGSMFHRAPGSIGASSDPSRVLPGNRMPGRMGGDRLTVLNLEVVRVDAGRNLLFVKGAVPGAENATVMVRPAVKVHKAVGVGR